MSLITDSAKTNVVETQNGRGVAYDAISFENVGSVAIDYPDAEGNGIWQINVYGDRAYLSCGTGGVAIVDISDVTAPTQLARETTQAVAYKSMRSNVLVGIYLYCVGRGASEGALEVWDISADTLSAAGVYENSAASSAKYSWLDSDGVEHVYVSGQKTSVESHDISTPASITRTDIDSTASYETQGCVVHNGYMIACNYSTGDALRALPIVDGAVRALVQTDDTLASYQTKEQRPWNCVADGDLLYVSTNEFQTLLDDPSQWAGLMIWDISDLQVHS